MPGLALGVALLVLAPLPSLVGAASADNACFDEPLIQRLLADARDLDNCFVEGGAQKCLIHKLSVKEQRAVNRLRLVPYDRTQSALMNEAVGQVGIKLANGGYSVGTGQKVSRCHVLTSAHVVFGDAATPVDDLEQVGVQAPNHELYFAQGQTCSGDNGRQIQAARPFFKMTRPGKDFNWGRIPLCVEGPGQRCMDRDFVAESDAVLLRLTQFDRSSLQYFRMRTEPLRAPLDGQWVDCWGFPGSVYLNDEDIFPVSFTPKLLWRQQNAKAFAPTTARGIPVNALARKGMSGGACIDQAGEVIGIFATSGTYTGAAPILIGPDSTPNFIAPLHHLAARYQAATGKSLRDLDRECD